jgi:hypothetical protein
MRHGLKQIDGQRLRFSAKVVRFGTRKSFHGWPEPTILLGNLCQDGCTVSDHLWFKCGKWSKDLQEGDTFEFEARVDSYMKGYQGYRAEESGEAWTATDYHLERPTKVRITAMQGIAYA